MRGPLDTWQSGPPDVASRSLDDGVKSGSPPVRFTLFPIAVRAPAKRTTQ
jgi:hypothetical protein